ncbi:hypothetical protein DOTSEDRAFT_22724 [Lecanosticta acicola]|uniref:H-type lectin domain-containing protein n=1 Tax=Lecanosticta acicola TaxID=111012 RepID=A0AAI8VUY1_9PEZI|nr:hypothetical protein DOTSEDRAFT_22724 [Lecanosticta acicola]
MRIMTLLAKCNTASTSELGLSTPMNRLENGAAGFTHLSEAGPDTGVFALSEVRENRGQADRGGSRIIALPQQHYEKPPQIAKGLKAFDLSHEARDCDGKRAIDIELCLITHPKNTSTMRPMIQARNSSSNTQLIHDAEMTWMEVKQRASDCMVFTTTWNLEDGERKKEVKFPRPQKGNVEVVCWIKDFRFRTWDAGPYSCDVWASNVTSDGFTANVSGGKNAERVTTTCIVYYKGKPKVASGTFSTEDLEARQEESFSNSGRIDFPKDTFTKTPTVLVALNQFDLAGGRDMSLGAYVSNVDQQGFDWQLNTRGDGPNDALRSAEASYVALGFV